MSKELTPLEALERIKSDLEYITRLDYVDPIVRGEVREELYKIYHRELPELDLIEIALKDYRLLKQDYEMIKEEYNLMIRYYAKDIKPKLKALEIIKELPQEEKEMLLNAIYTYTLSEEKYDLVKETLS